MSQKVVIEAARELRSVYTAELTQEAWEHLAACFVANQVGVDLDAEGVRIQVVTNIHQGANPRRKVGAKVQIFVTEAQDVEEVQAAPEGSQPQEEPETAQASGA